MHLAELEGVGRRPRRVPLLPADDAGLQTAKWFDNEHVRLFLGVFSLHANVAPDEVGGGQLAWLFDSILQEYGNKVVPGGMANVARALARCLEFLGGEIRTSAPVRRIVVEDGTARAVRLADGSETPSAGLVASSVDPRTLVVDLLGTDVVGDEMIDRIERYEWGDSIMVIYFAVDSPLEFAVGESTGPRALRALHAAVTRVRRGDVRRDPGRPAPGRPGADRVPGLGGRSESGRRPGPWSARSW